jgi:prolyl oligopeptidase
VLSVDDQGKVTPLDLPGNISMSGITVIDDQLVVPIQERWHVGSRSFEKGSVVAFDLKKALAEGGCIESAALVYEPSDGEAIPAFGCYSGSKNAYYLNVLKDVSSRVIRCTPRILKDQDWQSSAHDLPGFGTAVLPDRNNPDVDSVLFTYDSITTPPAYYLLDASGEIELIKKEPGLVNLDGYKTVQRFALSKDGIRIPYFVTHAKDIVMDGSNPVIMSAYGAFGVSHTCQYHNVYLGAVPHLWLQRGGVYVTVNPRGGGEYGPDWQEAAKQDERQNSYDDIYCVVEDMIKTGITSSGKVGAIYGSNGGLMTGVVCTQRPDLFGAGISLVPLLDMLRFHKLLAGASWIDEYGDPDISKDVEYLRSYSPYHNIFPGKSYPEIFFMTSTTDDRVHPGHARKMAAKMQEQGHSCLFYEATAGGHAMAVTPQGRAHNSAMQLVYFMLKLMDRCEIFP